MPHRDCVRHAQDAMAFHGARDRVPRLRRPPPLAAMNGDPHSVSWASAESTGDRSTAAPGEVEHVSAVGNLCLFRACLWLILDLRNRLRGENTGAVGDAQKQLYGLPCPRPVTIVSAGASRPSSNLCRVYPRPRAPWAAQSHLRKAPTSRLHQAVKSHVSTLMPRSLSALVLRWQS